MCNTADRPTAMNFATGRSAIKYYTVNRSAVIYYRKIVQVSFVMQERPLALSVTNHNQLYNSQSKDDLC